MSVHSGHTKTGVRLVPARGLGHVQRSLRTGAVERRSVDPTSRDGEVSALASCWAVGRGARGAAYEALDGRSDGSGRRKRGLLLRVDLAEDGLARVDVPAQLLEDDRPGLLRRGLVVEPGRGEDDARSDDEGDGDAEVEEGDGCEERDDDAQARGEALHDVVGVLDDHRRDQPAEHLHEDRSPSPSTEVLEQVPEPTA